jgi:hypothetical protein
MCKYMGRLKTKRMGNNFPGWLYVLEAGLEWNGACECIFGHNDRPQPNPIIPSHARCSMHIPTGESSHVRGDILASPVVEGPRPKSGAI